MRSPFLLVLGLLGGIGVPSHAAAQALPPSWNRFAEWVPMQNPSPGSGGNLVWHCAHSQGGPNQAVLSGNWDPFWAGWVSGGGSAFTGTAPITSVALRHMCYSSIQRRWHFVTPWVTFKNTTGQSLSLSIGGSLTVHWDGVRNGSIYAHDTPATVEISVVNQGVRTILLSRVVQKPTPGPSFETFTFPVNIPAFRLDPGDVVNWTVRGQDPCTWNAWVGLADKDLSLIRTVVATETVRQATPPNALTLSPGTTSRPIMGATWDPLVSNSPVGAVTDFLVFGVGALHLPGPFGTWLCSPLIVVTGPPGAPFPIPIPNQPVMLGAQLCVQGGAIAPASGVQLANALDIRIGNQ